MSIRDLADRLWANRLDRDPLNASIMGYHDRDHLMTDLSDDAVAGHVSELSSIRDSAAQIDSGALNEQDRITKELILHDTEVTLKGYEHGYGLGVIDTFVGYPSSLLLSVNSLTATTSEHAHGYIERWKQVDRFLTQAVERHWEQIDKGRPPARAVVERVINGVDGYLASPLDDDPFVTATTPTDGSGDHFAAEAKSVVDSVIRPAYASYRDYLHDEVLTISRDNDHVGMTNISDGDQIYADYVHRYTSLPASPESLHSFGRGEAEEKLPAEWASTGQEALGISDLFQLFDRLRTDTSLSYETEEQMIADAEATVEKAWAAIDGWFGARPETPCGVKAVPASIAPDLPPAYYMAPSDDGSRPGTYFINTYSPQSRKRYLFESIHFHEAIPGHHFDRSLSVELRDLPEFRRRFPSFAHAEGWGLYSERLADEMGLYSSAMDRLGMLSADAWRAGRLVVDTGMHYMGWSRQQAIDWMMKWTPQPQLVIEQEIDRYIGMAGQALAFKAGQREIFQLRREAESRLGSRFKIAAFHDTVLTAGGMTLPVLRNRVMDWIVGMGG